MQRSAGTRATWVITGSSGLLGANACEFFKTDEKVVEIRRERSSSIGTIQLIADLAQRNSLTGLVEDSGANVVFHAAAISSIEACASDPEFAWKVNVDASVELARQAAKTGAKFVFISTDAVFDGRTDSPYTEGVLTSPVSVYGETKVAAEQAVLEANPNSIVARVNFYGWSPTGRRSLVEFFSQKFMLGEPFSGFTDTKVSTLYIGDLLKVISELVRADASGIFNVASSGAVSKYSLALEFAHEFGFDDRLVSPAESASVLQHIRGKNMELDTRKVSAVVGYAMPTSVDGLARLHRDSQIGLPDRLSTYASAKGTA